MIPAHRPVSGVLDIVGGHHTLRVDGYLPSTADVTLSAGQARRYGLRRGDLVTGTVTGESRPGRPVPLDRLDTVNGGAARATATTTPGPRPTTTQGRPTLASRKAAARSRTS
ncbi:hypothetical protein ACLQ2W_22280, partial [Micromonospora sp. DT227]